MEIYPYKELILRCLFICPCSKTSLAQIGEGSKKMLPPRDLFLYTPLDMINPLNIDWELIRTTGMFFDLFYREGLVFRQSLVPS